MKSKKRAREQSEDGPKKQSADEEVTKRKKEPGVEEKTKKKNKPGLYDDLVEETVEANDPTERGKHHEHP